jgi:cell division septation protein DedD
MLALAKYPEMLTAAAQDFAPHDVTFYLRDLAAAYHSYYDAERILVDEEPVRLARLALVAATAQVLRNGLAMLGVDARAKCDGHAAQSSHARTTRSRKAHAHATWRDIAGPDHRPGDRAGHRPGVAVYVTKVPVPFVNKGQSRSVEQDAAEARKNKDWDPNAPLYGKNPARPAAAASAAGGTGRRHRDGRRTGAPGLRSRRPEVKPAVTGRPAGRPGEGPVIRRQVDPFTYFVQVGAYRTPEDAEAQRAKLSLAGVEARVSEREQSGRTVYRVRVGPFEKREDADRTKEKLEGWAWMSRWCGCSAELLAAPRSETGMDIFQERNNETS